MRKLIFMSILTSFVLSACHVEHRNGITKESTGGGFRYVDERVRDSTLIYVVQNKEGLVDIVNIDQHDTTWVIRNPNTNLDPNFKGQDGPIKVIVLGPKEKRAVELQKSFEEVKLAFSK